MYVHVTYLPSGCILALPVLDTCGPLGVGGDLPVFPGGVVVVVGLPLPPTIVSINITGLSVLVGLVLI